jgi:4-amino-4-deoxy-L-arabinose transferase-like glycosyltransferase
MEVSTEGRIGLSSSVKANRNPSPLPRGRTGREDSLRDMTWIVLASLIVFVLGLGNSRFWDQDEGYYASVAYEMYERGDWIVPTFNQELFAHKPPMMYWGMMAGFCAFGPSEFSARLFSALLGIGSALLTYWLGRRMFDAVAGLIAALALVSCLMFSIAARSATADAYLTFFVLVAICVWARDAIRPAGTLLESGRSPDEANPHALGVRTQTWCCVYLAIGMAVMSKGPIGFAFPVTILGIVHWLAPYLEGRSASNEGYRSSFGGLLQQLRPMVVLQSILALRPLMGVAMVSAVCAPWFWTMQSVTNGAFLSEFLGVHHLHRFSQPMDNHGGPIYYYVIACLVGLYPWTAFLIPTGWAWMRQDLWRGASRAALLVTAWGILYLFIFSLARTKLPSYVIPAYPAFALIVGYYVSSWRSYQLPVERAWQLVGWFCMLLVGVVLLVMPWVLTWQTASGTWMDYLQLDPKLLVTMRWVSVLGIPLVVGGFAGGWLRGHNRIRYATTCYAATAVTMMVLFWQVVVPIADQHQTPQDVALWLRSANGQGRTHPVAVLGYFRPSMVYYSGGTVRFCASPEELVQEANHGNESILVMSDTAFESLHEQLPSEYRIVERYPSFPRRGNMLILSPVSLVR